ncbi:Agamous-like MADS-box protein [Actinidia chinensis var. chinensis]|uniref:Agamous-like MADS-box protein n=1 Tax=Actinidia chinensis var. chinensis TaxID=1590841 RepID=A0A2R6RP07_ACTCC|nr:Agamous-like MADS-box protein [Actinidia chinensis var. chinensis]
MGRSVKHESITNERVRRQTFQKRKAGLFKKVSELQTLCGHDACAVIYGKVDAQQDVWPSAFGAYHLLERFSDLPIAKQAANMLDQENFLRQSVLRLSKNLEKEKKKTKWVEMEQVMMKTIFETYLHEVSNLEDLKDVDCFLDEKVKLVNDRIEKIKHDETETGS